MNIYQVQFYWKYSSENFEYGLIQANSLEEAKEKAKKIYSNTISIHVYELEFDEYGYCAIYSS